MEEFLLQIKHTRVCACICVCVNVCVCVYKMNELGKAIMVKSNGWCHSMIWQKATSMVTCEGLTASWRPEREAHLDPFSLLGVQQNSEMTFQVQGYPHKKEAKTGKAHP